MVNLAQAWVEEFAKNNPDVNMSLTGGGTGTGIAAFISGTCDIVAASRKMKAKEIEMAHQHGVEASEYIVALDGIAVVVNPANPVDKLTMDQLRDIFTGAENHWEKYGGKPYPMVVLSREINSGTHVFFKERVLRRGKANGPEEFAPSALLLSSSEAIAEEVSGNPGAIGYYGLGYISPRQKAVAISKDGASPYVLPSIETVLNGTYPISRPLYLYIKKDAPETVKKFIDFVYSKKGQELVRSLDFVPIK